MQRTEKWLEISIPFQVSVSNVVLILESYKGGAHCARLVITTRGNVADVGSS